MPWTGAFREQWAAPPRSLGQEPGRRSSEGPPSGAIPVPAVARLEFLLRAQARGGTGRERASWGTYNAARGAWRRHYLICEAFFRRSAPSSGEEAKRLFDHLGPQGRGTMKRVSLSACGTRGQAASAAAQAARRSSMSARDRKSTRL